MPMHTTQPSIATTLISTIGSVASTALIAFGDQAEDEQPTPGILGGSLMPVILIGGAVLVALLVLRR